MSIAGCRGGGRAVSFVCGRTESGFLLPFEQTAQEEDDGVRTRS